jgi:hypothetical protein
MGETNEWTCGHSLAAKLKERDSRRSRAMPTCSPWLIELVETKPTTNSRARMYSPALCIPAGHVVKHSSSVVRPRTLRHVLALLGVHEIFPDERRIAEDIAAFSGGRISFQSTRRALAQWMWGIS